MLEEKLLIEKDALLSEIHPDCINSEMGKTVKKNLVPSADQKAREVVEEMEKKIRKCNSHSDREVLRGALHLLQCDGCGDDRFIVLNFY